MGGRKSAWGWALVVAGRCFTFGAVAQSPESGPERLFFREHPVLQFIEQRLPPSATIVVPPDPMQGRHVATDAELRAAFGRVLADFLAPPSTFASKAGDLIGEVCRYRPAQTTQWIAVATDAILKHSLPSVEKDLDDAVTAAIAANPRDSGAVVREAIRRIAAGIDAGAFRSAGRLEREAAARAAGRVVGTGIKAAKTAPLVREIVEQGLEEGLAQSGYDLVVETMAAAVIGGQGVEGARVGDLTRLAFAKFGRSKIVAGMICAGAIKGAGRDAAAEIKDQAALNMPVPFSAYANIVCNAYVALAAAPQAAGFEVSRFINVTNADYIPAVMIGAIVAAPRAATEILQAGLNRDLVLRGRATTREIVEAAIMACEQSAPELAAAAVGHGDLQEGNAPALISEGVARGTPPAGIRAALAAQLGRQEKSAATIKATVAGAMAGAIATEKMWALSAIAMAAAADPNFAAEVLDQAIISAPRERQYAGVLGVLAARPEQAAALLARALKHGDLVAEQAGPIAAGGAVIIAMQTERGGFYRPAAQRLGALDRSSSATVDAIVLGAALANPRGASAVAAAALAGTQAPAESLSASATQGDPGAASRIAQALDSAISVQGQPGNLFQSVRAQIAVAPDAAPEIVTGAMAAAPRLGHVTGHAAALAAPGSIAQIVPRLFAFSGEEDSADSFAALTSGVVRGVIDANLEPASESEALAEVVAWSIRSVVALGRARGAAAASLPEGEAITAVVTAATSAARSHAVEIAQVAARTARALACPVADQARIKDAVLAAHPPADAAKVVDAIGAGIAEADLQVPAAGVKALLDYTRESLTGRPMTSFRDL